MLDRQLAGSGAFEDFVDKRGRTTVQIGKAALRACRSEGIDEPLTLRRYTVHPSKSMD